ncbi:MAG: hypothetical protein HUJ22_08750 [Gracilimonas sp.]|uniref:hypothetical protein n=1 Tax=Gracilimonas sp. TaxID=1974203 RepID=UPI0019A6827E|nr:hypothetical protein [Gracilimonas sp.]MBD3616649.1 hypothetical protein [Gracilimonas sp.]
MKSDKVSHKVIQSLKLQGKSYPVYDMHGSIVDEVRGTRVKGLELIAVKDCERLGIKKSVIKHLMKEGKLRRFHPNGNEKTDSRPTTVYFDIDEFLGLAEF